VNDSPNSYDPDHVELIGYRPEYRDMFRALNVAWIERYFTMEPADYNVLDTPQESILDPGGEIVLARLRGAIVGTCAMVPMDDGGVELAKMAVAESARGRGIGVLLGRAIIARARARGAPRVYLESNTRLEVAIALYRKLGFVEITGEPSPYARCNIQMELKLEQWVAPPAHRP
jgi:GNAT superfamily N-acetyltransferase